MSHKILQWILYILCITVLFISIKIIKKENQILKELKELNSTLEYIDKRMDTLEFCRMPD